MIKITLILLSLLTPMTCFSQSVYDLPSGIVIDPNNPSAAFPHDIQQNFSISANLMNNECKKNQAYTLTFFIYRNAVDNKMVGSYRALNASSLCWIDLISYSVNLHPDLTASGWKLPKTGENTWCSQEGLKNPVSCAFVLR